MRHNERIFNAIVDVHYFFCHFAVMSSDHSIGTNGVL